jgi:glycosyltransferase involved in cell wall biosynthesis
MKVAFLSNMFLPKWIGGTEVATAHIAEELAARGHEVHIITMLDDGLPRESVENGACVHRLRWLNLKFVGFLFFCLEVLHTLRRIDPQIVHAQEVSAGLYGVLAKLVLNKPCVVWSQGYTFQSTKRRSAIVLKHADAVIALSDDMKHKLQRLWERNVYVIPNGIRLQAFEKISRADARRDLNIGEAAKIVLFVGRLEPIKGVKHLIEAMPAIKEVEPEARLLLVGDGSERTDLERLVDKLGLSECVIFAGRVSEDDVPTYTVASDVFVLPSISEGFGIVNLEAMAAGLPIVASNIGGIPSLVEAGVNGFLVDPGNAAQIASRVSLLLSDPELRQLMSANNQEKVQCYTVDKVTDDLERIYLSCIRAT